MKIFISSVQKEFAAERKALAKMIREDRWLSGFFEVFLFEECTAKARTPQKVYLDAVAESDIYIGLIGDAYGNVDKDGVSPTEREYDKATEIGKDRLIFVNAVCHRDYTSNACVQVMLFRDRLEVINPGSLPKGTTVQDLLISHDSNPRNHVIARVMSWTNYVEKSGSGTGEIIRLCREAGLADPVFESMTGHFKTTIWRRGYGTDQGGLKSKGPSDRPKSKGPSRRGRVEGAESRVQCKGPVQGSSARVQSKGPVQIVDAVCRAQELSISGIAQELGLKAVNGYLKRSLAALVADGMLERTAGKLHSHRQKYRLTAKGTRLVVSLKKKGCRK